MTSLGVMAPEHVEDPADPRVADFVGLTDGARRRKHEPGTGFFIAEGEKVIARTAAAGYPVRNQDSDLHVYDRRQAACSR